MIRFAWLQSRTQLLIVAAALAALAIVAAITGVELAHLHHSLVTQCQGGCDLGVTRFLSHQQFLQRALGPLVDVVPALLGIFWGAPLLARELETGTYRLAWTQSVTRRRWLLTKFGVLGLAAAVVAGLLTLTITWWYRSLDAVDTSRWSVFDRRDIVPIGYAVFAFAVGVLLGAVIRRVLPAMAGTLGIFVVVRIAVTLWVRPHLLPPRHMALSLLGARRFGFEIGPGSAVSLVAGGGAPPGAWGVSSRLVTDAGQPVNAAAQAAFLHRYCPTISGPPTGAIRGHNVTKTPDPTAFRACQAQAAQHFHLAISYQPASRYWTFQWLELGGYLVLALVAALAAYWWVTRRSN